MTLTVLEARNAKPAEKPYKIADDGGLYLLVSPQGSKLWRLDYRFSGKRKTLALGVFPDVSLADARDAQEEAKRKLRANTDPSEERKASKRKREIAANSTFALVAARWFNSRKGAWTEAYAGRVWSRIETDIVPAIGIRPVDEVEPNELLSALRSIEGRGAVETAHRVRNYLADIFRYAKSERLVRVNPVDEMAAALSTPRPPVRRPSLKTRDLPDFLKKLASYDGERQTRLALRLTLLTFVRTSEVRFAGWDEFEGMEGREPLWRIPAARMKMRSEHIVPLSKQVVAVLNELRPLAGKSRSVFPAPTGSGVISENTMLYAMYRMGYHSRATPHGFRSTASTVLNEKGFNRDWVERQLAHVERNEIRAAYNAAEWLPQRRKMMQWWADYLDRCTDA